MKTIELGDIELEELIRCVEFYQKEQSLEYTELRFFRELEEKLRIAKRTQRKET